MMRALSFRQAAACENATRPVCRCRCGGQLHGAARVATDPSRADFERLPAEDPHHLPTADERRARRRRQWVQLEVFAELDRLQAAAPAPWD